MNFTPTKWTHYLTRPFSLFGNSLWYVWYADYASRYTSIDISDMLSVEESLGLIRNYRTAQALENLKISIGTLAIENKEECLALLDKASEYNREAQDYISGNKSFPNISEAANFFFELALHATILPHFIIQGLGHFHKEDHQLFEIAEKLRSQSLYPKFLTTILQPMVVEILTQHGFQDAHAAADLVTIQEVLANDFSKIPERMQQRKEGKLFVYQVENRVTQITWHASTADLISQIEGVLNAVSEIKGQVAFPGKVKGAARVVKTIDGKGAIFNQGDILVSINSNPNLMDLIRKASAIITDEGGITCHAAIIARELKIPCVIGTKNATRVFKDGDVVEVDANTGVIRKIA